MLMKAAKIGQLDDSKHQAVIVIGDGEPDASDELEVWGQLGVWAVPPDGTPGLFVPIGYGQQAIIAAVKALVQVSGLVAGEAAFGSTDATGATVKALVKARRDGSLELNGNGKKLVTYAALNTALQGLVTAINAKFATKQDAGGAAGGLSLDISASATTTLKTDG
jgi:phage gp45-like